LNQAAKKWKRLQEELEDEMLGVQSGTTFQRKRRVDVTLAMGDLVQRQRRRINPSEPENEHHSGSNCSSKVTLANNLDSAMAAFLTKCSLGNPIDKDSVENIMKYAYGGSTDSKCTNCNKFLGTSENPHPSHAYQLVYRNWRFACQASASHNISATQHIRDQAYQTT
jgi:hypothetical protein